MYIDFHTHAFNDVIAERAITKLEGTLIEQGYTDDVPAATRGTVAQLLERMDEWGIDKAVVLNIATKPSQQTVINNWAKEIQSDRIFCFGSVHPEAEDALDELENPADEDIMAEVENVVVALNELNANTDDMLIETVEREAIWEIIQDAAVECGLEEEYDDVTEEWREW